MKTPNEIKKENKEVKKLEREISILTQYTKIKLREFEKINELVIEFCKEDLNTLEMLKEKLNKIFSEEGEGKE